MTVTIKVWLSTGAPHAPLMCTQYDVVSCGLTVRRFELVPTGVLRSPTTPLNHWNVSALPVRDLGPAIAYYESVLGFTVTRRDATTVALKRDGAQIGLVVKSDHQPGEAGSLAFAVDDLNAMHRELSEREINQYRRDRGANEQKERIHHSENFRRLMEPLQLARDGSKCSGFQNSKCDGKEQSVAQILPTVLDATRATRV